MDEVALLHVQRNALITDRKNSDVNVLWVLSWENEFDSSWICENPVLTFF